MLQGNNRGPTRVAEPFCHSLGPAFIHVTIACPGLSFSHLLTLTGLSQRLVEICVLACLLGFPCEGQGPSLVSLEEEIAFLSEDPLEVWHFLCVRTGPAVCLEP